MTARRAVLLGTLTSTAALAVPAVAAFNHRTPAVLSADPPRVHPETELWNAIRELKRTAMVLDPTIKGLWVSYQELDDPGEFSALSGIYFNRAEAPRGAVREAVPSTAERELEQVERLISKWRNAVAHHDDLFDQHDNGLNGVTQAQVCAGIDPIDDVFEELCLYRPWTSAARARRSSFLAKELTGATYGCEGLMERMYRALTV